MTQMTYREALREAMREEMRRDSSVFLFGEEVAEYQGAYKVTEGLLAEFGPERVLDTPIAEEVIAGLGVGAAMAGLRPIGEFMTVNFMLLALDQIVNHAAKIHYMFGGQLTVPVVFRAPQGAGKQLGAQHSQFLENYFVQCPGLRVVAPATPADAKALLKTAIRSPDPVIFLEHLDLYTMKGEVPEGENLLPFGQAQLLREGKDVTLIGYSKTALMAEKAAELLEKESIHADVIDLRTLNPLDLQTILMSVRKTHRVILVSEAPRTGGFTGELAALIQEHAFDYLDAPIVRMSGLDVPMPYNRMLEQRALPHVSDIVEHAKILVSQGEKP